MNIPMSSVRQSDSSTFCLHGCDQWISGGLSIAVSYGLWAPSSFDGESWGTACRAERASVSVVVMQPPDQKSVIAWPRPHKGNVGNDAVVNLKWSTEEERAEALRIIGSIRR
jgi:hypothetical protein